MKLQRPDLNKPAFVIFPDKARLIEQGKCPFCYKDIKEEDFKDELSKKEYSISGTCFFCQKEVFSEE